MYSGYNMIRSMTGYGKAIAENDSARVTVEMKSVNHRYLDLSIKSPRKLNYLEQSIRNRISSDVIRGKVDLYITLDEHADANFDVSINTVLAKKYLDEINSMATELSVDNDIKASTLTRLPDVIEIREKQNEEDVLKDLVFEALNKCIAAFVETRESEGARLKNDLLAKMDEISSLVSKLEERSPVIIDEYREKLRAKVKELLDNTEIDEGRIAQEVVLYADKICIDEEMVRLKSHVAEVKDIFANSKEAGRRLDFLAQELNRESNTILSKSTDVEVADIGITLKTLIEKIREQVQNIE